jgi:outer membrane protein assembly factor BamB
MRRFMITLLAIGVLCDLAAVSSAEDWPQVKYDARRSGNVPDRQVRLPLGLVGAVPMTDAVLASPAVADGRVYVVDASGVMFCLDAVTLQVRWKFASPGGAANCNNVSSPAVASRYVHFGTMAGGYYVLDTAGGTVVKEIVCGEPILSAPVVSEGRVYFATLGSRVYALEPDGTLCWTWDYVRERLGFSGDRWSGEAWSRFKRGRVTWKDQFCCSQDLAARGKMVVVPAGGETIWLEDTGAAARLAGVGLVPNCAGTESPATFGQSIGEDGTVYRQWHRRDNTGRVEMLRLADDGHVTTDFVRGTLAAVNRSESLGFSSVSIRGQDVFRCRPERSFGFCRHAPGGEQPQYLGGPPAIASPVLVGDKGIYGSLDGRLCVVPLDGSRGVWSFATAFARPVSAPACVCDGRIYFGCEDGYLYALGPGGSAPMPAKDLELWRVRSPLTGKYADSKYDWFTNYGDQQSTNFTDQALRLPVKVKWIRRYEGTFKHTPVCGGGRMYTHTAEGQLIAVEAETGRLLWRRYFPGVHACFTSPLYWKERLLVPQAGLDGAQLRCLDAATGRLLWQAPFSGSPSWSRQQPPVVHGSLAIYAYGTGKHTAGGDRETLGWLYSHDNPSYPTDHRPLVRAWDIDTGREAWTRDFSEYGTGGDDGGVCLMDGTLYYSCFFGYAAKRRGEPGPHGVTAALDPADGRVRWLTTKYSVTAGTTISAAAGRLYLGGYNAADSKSGPRHVWCLDARDGRLIWQSDPLIKSINVVTVGPDFVFAHAYGTDSYLLDKATGKILSKFNKDYACTRFTLAGRYLLGANMDLIDTAAGHEVVSSGPCVDLRECVGAMVSNGRIFYTSQANGLQVSQVYGQEAERFKGAWRRAGEK